MGLRERPKVMTLTDAAADRIKQIMANSPETVIGLRVGVKKGGCAGMEYTMEYASEQAPHEDVVEEKGVKILIEPKAILERKWTIRPKNCHPALCSKTQMKRALAAVASLFRLRRLKRFSVSNRMPPCFSLKCAKSLTRRRFETLRAFKTVNRSGFVFKNRDK